MKLKRLPLLLGFSFAVGGAFAADDPAPAMSATNTAPNPPMRATLPDAHPYQQTLRKFMGTLTEKDFEHGVTGGLTRQPSSQDPEYQYRNHLFTMMLQPMIGTKRGAPSVNAPANLFTLSSIEGANGVMRPPVWPESLIAFERWDYPGNPYHNNRALRLRAFVAAAINLMMLDDYLDKTPTACRSDWMGYQLVYIGVPYLGSKEILPAEVQKAFEDGLKKLGQRVIAWGPKGEEPNMDLTAPVGLWYVSKACNDPVFTKEVETCARKLLTDPRYFHPAGYHVERGGLDVGYGGMANFFTIWLALASDWPFARDAVERAYRLIAHLRLPEPNGRFTGPTHFNTRIGVPACADANDQWDWVFRDYAAAMVTDEAAYMTKLPSAETLQAAAVARAGMFNHALEETQGIRFKGATAADFAKLRGGPWKYHLWMTHGFPASVNFGYEFYPKGAYAHRLQLEKDHSPLLKSPFLREGTFVRNFENAFIVAKQPTYSVILHTGPVGTQDPGDGLFQFKGPLGFGGGQLSAFWTPATGAIILGRRAGMGWDATIDKVEEWRLWPIHAVSGCTPDGKVFTSARIAKPEVAADLKKDGGTVTVSGSLPAEQLGQGKVLEGLIGYKRAFQIESDKIQIETTVKTDGKDKVAELYETLPVFLREDRKTTPTAIEFQTDDKWIPATEAYQEKVTAIRLTRFEGAVQIKLDHPRRVKLSPQDWKDTYLSTAVCRNIMIDLLEDGKGTVNSEGAKVVRYEFEIASPPRSHSP